MRGRIIFSNGHIVSFSDDNYEEVIADLTEDQKHTLAKILRQRMGPKNEHPYDPEVYAAWYEDVHRKDITRGGGSGNSDGSKINPKGGKKYSVKDWKDKGDSDRNIIWLRGQGFHKKWDDTSGYRYVRKGINVPMEWLDTLDHELFKVKVTELCVR